MEPDAPEPEDITTRTGRRRRQGRFTCSAHGGTGRRRAEAGSVVVAGLAFVMLIMLASLVSLDIGMLVANRARAETAADLAALAAVVPGSADSPGNGPGRARAIAEANGAQFDACVCGPREAIVTASISVPLLLGAAPVRVHARARAVLAPPVIGETP